MAQGDDMQTEKNVNIAEEYLFGGRDLAVLELARQWKDNNINSLVPILKQKIFDYVNQDQKYFLEKIDLDESVYDLFLNFNSKEFAGRNWKHSPFYIEEKDYKRIQGCVKNLIYTKRYNYQSPIHEFQNSVPFENNAEKLKNEEKIKNDIQYYISQKEDMLFAKLVNLKYKPKSLSFLKSLQKNMLPEEREFAVNRIDLYERSLSIAMYVLINGDPKKAMPFMRYDNASHPHNNVWVGDDRRKYIYGEVAQSPHFHFQNERDSLLCLRKYTDKNDGKVKYRTGRCNAIDCKHLAKYLVRLDKMNLKKLKSDSRFSYDYDMPFLNMKLNHMVVSINLEKIFTQYIANKNLQEKALLQDVQQWLEISKKDSLYGGLQKEDGCFYSLIKALDFLTFISTLYSATLDPDKRKMLSDLEIDTANAVMNAINQNSNYIITESNKPKYSIESY